MSESTRQLLEQIHAALSRAARRVSLGRLMAGIALVTGVLSGLVLLLTAAEALFWLPPSIRMLLFGALVVSSLFLLTRFVFLPAAPILGLPGGPSDREIAARVGKTFPEIGDRLVNLLQLESGHRSEAPGKLVEGAIQQLGEKVRSVDYEEIEKFESVRKTGRYAVLPVLALLAFAALTPANFTGAAERLFNPTLVAVRPAPFSFVVHPGDTTIVRGDSIEVEALAMGSVPSTAEITIQRLGETRRERRGLASAGESFRYTVENVRDPFRYRIESGEVVSRWFEVEVASRPFVRILQASVNPPPYTRLPRRSLPPNVGDVAALSGSRVDVRVVASDPAIERAFLEFDSGTRAELTIDGNSLSGSFVVDEPDSYRVHLISRRGIGNTRPVEYKVKPIQDAYPVVVQLAPGPISDMSDLETVALLLRIGDDFGLTSLKLFYRLAESRFDEAWEDFREIRLPGLTPLELDQEIAYDWIVEGTTPVDPVPGDVIEYYVEVRDNDVVSGPKRTATPISRLEFPSLADRYEEMESKESEIEDEIQDMVDESEQIRDQFEELRDDLRREQMSDWDDERMLDRLEERQSQLEEQVSDLAEKVDELVNQMEEQQLVSPETLERFSELQRVVDEINSPELMEALQELREAMRELDLTEMQRSLGQTEFDAEQFRQRLERALELFKRLRTEQKLDEAARRAEDLARREENLSEQTEKLEPETEKTSDRQSDESQHPDEESDEAPATEADADSAKSESDDTAEKLAEEQERASQEMEELQELMERIQQEMDELSPAPTEQMEEVRQRTEEQDLSEQMRQNAEQLRQGELQEAQDGQQQMQQSLQQLAAELSDLQEQMSGEQLAKNLAALRRALDDVLTLSLEEERLREGVSGLAARDAGLRRFAQQQSELHQGLTLVSDTLLELSKAIPQMSSRLQAYAGSAAQDMERAVTEMAERRAVQAIGHQKSAMTNLNELALMLSELMQSMQSQQSGMAGMSMQQMIQQMQQMAGEQAKLNQQIQQMLNDMQGQRLSQDMQQRLSQMAAQQEALRRQLEQMQETGGGDLDRLLGDLEKIGRQMEESVREFEQRQLDQRTIDRQQEILTRLLNAQKSLRERGREERRQGRTGEDVDRESPPEYTRDEGVDRLRRELLRALESGYSVDYEELIRNYFDALRAGDKKED